MNKNSKSKLVFLSSGIIPIFLLLLLVPSASVNVNAGEDERNANANPYCDLLSSDERRVTTCHDRRDASDTTGLVTCNDGSHREFEDWQDCPDVSGYDYDRASSNEGDWSQGNIDALVDCTDQGYDDGQNGPFNHDKFRQCEALSESIDSNLEGEKSTYYEAFINGCIDAGNTEEICERFTD